MEREKLRSDLSRVFDQRRILPNLPAKKARQAPFRHCDSDADLELLSRQDFLRGVFVFRENFPGENLTKKRELVGLLLLLIFSPFHFSNSDALFFLN